MKEEVVYIISEKEKAVFLALESEGDRDLFIEEFWRQRDPISGTPRNEFRAEHYRRIEFANQTFGRGTPMAGWRTDQGRPATDDLTLGSLLATKTTSEGTASAGRRGFQAGELQLFPTPGNVFSPDANFRLFFQVFGLSPELRTSGRFEFGLARDGRAVRTTEKNIRDYGAGDGFLEPVALDGLAPGRYALTVSLRDGQGQIRLSNSLAFEIAEQALPSTWVFSPKNPAPGDARYDYALGLQLLNLERVPEASEALARAREKDPASAEIASACGRAFLLQGRAAEARDVLMPFAEAEPGRFEVQAELGQAAQALGDTKEAILRYVKALSLRGRIVEVLNALGECYLSYGNREKAAKAWRDSLAIDPNQEAVKRLLGSLAPDKQGAVK